jgi:hypothetical protein
MENLKTVMVVIFCLVGITSSAQDAFYKTYSGSTFDEGQGIAQMSDSGYLITGSTAGFTGSSDAFIMRIDKFGTQEWTKSYGGENSDWGRRIFYEEGEGIWCMGYTNSLDAQSFDFYVFKTDEDGVLEWEKTIGTPDWEKLRDAKRLPNGDFILVGETQGADALNEDILIVRIDDEGNELWMERIQTSGSDIPYAVSVLNDTTVIIAGESFNGTNQAAFLLSMHIDGTSNWMSFYESTLEGTFYDLDIYDNNIYAVGGLIAAGETKPDLWMVRTDSDGVLIYDHLDVRQETAYYSVVKMMGDGRLYVSIISDSPSFNPYTDGLDMFVSKYHQNLFWNGFSSPYSGVNDDFFHQIIATNDDGIALAGTVSDNRVINTPGTDVTVVKIGPNDEAVVAASNQDLLEIVNFTKGSLQVYPNPMVNELVVKVGSNKVVDYEFYSTDGRIQLSGRLEGGKINVESLSAGIYMLQLHVDGEIRIVKLIK